jgi:hypothetical protein
VAGDLIPPPSPAGRPDADAGRVPPPEELRVEGAPRAPWGREVADRDEELVEARPDEGREERRPRPDIVTHRSRFGFITGALAGTGVAALVVTILIVFGGGGSAGDAAGQWSSWKPTSSDTFGAAAEIAAHVGNRYRLDDGSQMVAVESGPIAFRNEVLAQVRIRTAPVGGNIVAINGNGLLYTFNGLGVDGSIQRGEASAKRLALLKLEALELALYTFRYIDAVDHVVIVLPPPPPGAAASATTQPTGPTGPNGAATGATGGVTITSTAGTPASNVLFFRPGDLRSRLDAPLAASIPTSTPRPGSMTVAMAAGITELTRLHVFNASFQQDFGNVYLALERPKAATTSVTVAPMPTPAATATPGAKTSPKRGP